MTIEMLNARVAGSSAVRSIVRVSTRRGCQESTPSAESSYGHGVRRQGLLDSPRACGVSDHVCWSFVDDDDFLAAASIWAIEGFGLGQRVVYLADRSPT